MTYIKSKFASNDRKVQQMSDEIQKKISYEIHEQISQVKELINSTGKKNKRINSLTLQESMSDGH